MIETIAESYPTTKKRKVTAMLLSIIALCAVLIGFKSSNTMMIFSGIITALIALYFYKTSWTMVLDDKGALLVASKEVDFPIGPASAQLGFYGWLAKPLWRVVIFSSDESTNKRALVEIDAMTKEIISVYSDESQGNETIDA